MEKMERSFRRKVTKIFKFICPICQGCGSNKLPSVPFAWIPEWANEVGLTKYKPVWKNFSQRLYAVYFLKRIAIDSAEMTREKIEKWLSQITEDDETSQKIKNDMNGTLKYLNKLTDEEISCLFAEVFSCKAFYAHLCRCYKWMEIIESDTKE